jgi:hypothetical protein
MLATTTSSLRNQVRLVHASTEKAIGPVTAWPTRRSIPDSLFPVVTQNSACRDLAARLPLARELRDVLPGGTTAAADVAVPEYRIDDRDPAGPLHSFAVTVDLQVEGLLTSSCDSSVQPRR